MKHDAQKHLAANKRTRKSRGLEGGRSVKKRFSISSRVIPGLMIALDSFVNRCAPYFSGNGSLVDQPFASRLAEGMIRAYLVEREVVGFARQQPAGRSVDPAAPAPDRVLGMPSAKTMYPANQTEFQTLRERLEDEWVPQLRGIVDIDDAELPVLWDADFLYGTRDEDGADTYMLCEINVSSVIPYPDAAAVKVAQAVKRRCEQIGSR